MNSDARKPLTARPDEPGGANGSAGSGSGLAGAESRRIHLRDISENDGNDEISSLGELLRAVRLSRSEDLDNIARHLKIKRSHLAALEADAHESLPGRTYALGFVRSYAAYLGLDVNECVARYKAEAGVAPGLVRDPNLEFPEVPEETRLPRGSVLIVFLVIGALLYGGWLLSVTADRQVAESQAPGQAPNLERLAPPKVDEDDAVAAAIDHAARQRAAASATAPAPRATGVAGDPVSAATPEGGVMASAQPPAAAPDSGQSQQGVDVAALAPGEDALPQAGAVVGDQPRLPLGTVYGVENRDYRVILRARNDAWVRVEDSANRVKFTKTLKAGDSYRAPNDPGLLLVARDAGAIEVIVDGRSIGQAGPRGLVLTGMSLDPDRLVSGTALNRR